MAKILRSSDKNKSKVAFEVRFCNPARGTPRIFVERLAVELRRLVREAGGAVLQHNCRPEERYAVVQHVRLVAREAPTMIIGCLACWKTHFGASTQGGGDMSVPLQSVASTVGTVVQRRSVMVATSDSYIYRRRRL